MKIANALDVMERSESWAQTASTDYTVATEVQIRSLNLSKCKLTNPLTVPPLRDKARKILIAFPICLLLFFYSQRRLTSAGDIACDWVLLLTCQDWLCFILDIDSSKEE